MADSTRATQPQRTKFDEIEWAADAKQESAYGTPLVTGDLTLNLPRKTEMVAVDRNPVVVGDDEVGYGDEWPTNDYIDRNELKLEGIPFRLSSQAAMLAAALGLGKVVTVDNADGSFKHTFTPWDLTAAKVAGQAGFSQPPSTSFRYKEGPNQFIAHGVCQDSFEVSGAPESFPDITLSLIGSGGETADANAFSAVAVPNLMKLVNVQVGVVGSLESIIDAVRDATFKWNLALAADEGYTVGQNALLGERGQLFAGQRGYDLGINFDQHSTDVERAALLAQTAQKIVLTYEGDVIAGLNKHHMIITCFRVRIGTRGQSDSNNRKVNDIEYKGRADGSRDFMQIEVQNTFATAVLPIAV